MNNLCASKKIAASALIGMSFCASRPVSATPVFESAASAGSGCLVAGTTVDSSTYLAARFTLNSSQQISGIGGRVCGFQGIDNSLFVAIAPLASSAALPSFSAGQLAGNSLFSAPLLAPLDGSDALAAVSFSLAAGDYAIIIGSGAFGATGLGFMPDDNTDLAGSSYFFAADSGAGLDSWTDGGIANVRFVLTADSTVPEPSASLLLALGVGLLGYRCRSFLHAGKA